MKTVSTISDKTAPFILIPPFIITEPIVLASFKEILRSERASYHHSLIKLRQVSHIPYHTHIALIKFQRRSREHLTEQSEEPRNLHFPYRNVTIFKIRDMILMVITTPKMWTIFRGETRESKIIFTENEKNM